jgi:hypothetical protein
LGIVDKTAHGLVTVLAAILATNGRGWKLGLPSVVFSPELSAVHERLEAIERSNRDTRLIVLDRGPGGAPIRSD